MRRLKENLFLQFLLISFVVMMGIGLAVAILLANAIQSRVITTLVDEATVVASGRLLRTITPSDLEVPMTGERYRQFHDFVQESIISEQIAQVKLWSKDTTLIYSNISTEVGQKFPDNEDLLKALRGQATASIEAPEKLETESERLLGTLIEVYVPLIFTNTTEPQGAFEIYQFYEPTARQINDLRRLTFTLIGIGLLVLYGALSHLVWRSWRRITQQQTALVMADRLASLGELVSGVAHELNNPLTSVIGFSDLLLERENIPEDIKEDLKTVNREAQRTASIVRNLLTFARQHPQEKQTADMNKLIQAMLELRAYEQKVNNIQVITNFAPDLPQITANSFQLQQVFFNIIINAEYFMIEAHGKGILTITTERTGDFVRVSFADDGPGIPKANLNRIFDPFFTTKEVGKGTGLGLSICHGIVTEHHGKIYAESEPGKGATFFVALPVSKK